MAIELPEPSSKLGKLFKEFLSPGEIVSAAVLSASSGMSLHSVLVATNLGAIIIKKGGLGFAPETTRYPYWQITNVSIENLLFGSRVEISALGVEEPPQEQEIVWGRQHTVIRPRRKKTTVVKILGPNVFAFKRRGGRLNAVRAVVGVINEQVAHAGTPSSQPSANIPEQIRQLAALRDAGALSNTEFEAKKAELLARM
jgi:hypothetical protein